MERALISGEALGRAIEFNLARHPRRGWINPNTALTHDIGRHWEIVAQAGTYTERLNDSEVFFVTIMMNCGHGQGNITAVTKECDPYLLEDVQGALTEACKLFEEAVERVFQDLYDNI